MHEEMMREFGVPPREMPILDLLHNGVCAASLEPRALWVIGANGRLDFEQERHHAAAHADTAGIARIETKQRVNDQAYFVLCWGQLEAEIDQACREAIRRHRNDTSWSVRRAWDLWNGPPLSSGSVRLYRVIERKERTMQIAVLGIDLGQEQLQPGGSGRRWARGHAQTHAPGERHQVRGQPAALHRGDGSVLRFSPPRPDPARPRPPGSADVARVCSSLRQGPEER